MGFYHLSFIIYHLARLWRAPCFEMVSRCVRDASYMSPNWLLITLQRYKEKQQAVHFEIILQFKTRSLPIYKGEMRNFRQLDS